MYKLLLCLRYLRTRYLAMVCIVSVMLGVATLIVVNSVMSGFSTKLRERLHGLLSDVVLEGPDYYGFDDPEGKMALVRSDPFLARQVEAMTPTLEIFAMLQYDFNGRPFARQVRLIGIDPVGRAKVGGFAEHLTLGHDRPSFDLSDEAKRRQHDLHRPRGLFLLDPVPPIPAPGEKPTPDPPPSKEFVPEGLIVGHAIAHWRGKDEHGV